MRTAKTRGNMPASTPSLVQLQQENSALQEQLKTQDTRIQSLEEQVALREEMIRHLRDKLFGRTSEKRSYDDTAMGDLFAELFDEAEALAAQEAREEAAVESDASEEETTAPSDKKNKKSKGRRKLPSDLPRVVTYHDIADDQKQCACGCELTRIGSESSEQLDYISAKLRVIEHVQYKYACKSCEDTVCLAPPPVKPIQKSIATSGLLAHVIVSKFCDHLPLYRQSGIWERVGIDLSRQTLSGWMLRCGELLEPVADAMKQAMTQSDYVCSDETTLRILDNTDTKINYMWCHMSGSRQKRCVYYEAGTRSSLHVNRLFEGFKGYHQSDGYNGYTELHKKEGVTYVACWDHARRKFVEVEKLAGQQKGVASAMLGRIRLLYNLERQVSKYRPEVIQQKRQQRAVPILKKIKQELDRLAPIVAAKTPLAKAISYALNQWEGLCAYTKDGRLRLSNADTERAIKPFVIGRKNWMFSQSYQGANASAVLFSLIETAKANQIDPYRYVRYLLDHIHEYRHNKQAVYELLPFNIDPALLK